MAQNLGLYQVFHGGCPRRLTLRPSLALAERPLCGTSGNRSRSLRSKSLLPMRRRSTNQTTSPPQSTSGERWGALAFSVRSLVEKPLLSRAGDLPMCQLLCLCDHKAMFINTKGCSALVCARVAAKGDATSTLRQLTLGVVPTPTPLHHNPSHQRTGRSSDETALNPTPP